MFPFKFLSSKSKILSVFIVVIFTKTFRFMLTQYIQYDQWIQKLISTYIRTRDIDRLIDRSINSRLSEGNLFRLSFLVCKILESWFVNTFPWLFCLFLGRKKIDSVVLYDICTLSSYPCRHYALNNIKKYMYNRYSYHSYRLKESMWDSRRLDLRDMNFFAENMRLGFLRNLRFAFSFQRKHLSSKKTIFLNLTKKKINVFVLSD